MLKKGKKSRRKNRWATAKGRVVSVRFSEEDYFIVSGRAKNRGLSVGEYLRWIARVTYEADGELVLNR